MRVRFKNQQDKSDPMNGASFETPADLAQLLDKRRGGVPVMADLTGENEFELLIGIGSDIGCAQYSHVDGSPPYLMAVSKHPAMKRGYVEFLNTNTPTPVAARYIISFAELKEVAVHFVRTGGRSDIVSWLEFNPQAARDDAAPLS